MNVAMLKKCKGTCGEEKLLADFGVAKGGKFGRRGQCHSCYNAANKHYNRKRLYGITKEEYQLLLKKHGYVCGICEKKPDNEDLCVDHIVSSSGIIVRGLLCKTCNRGLGKLGDNINGVKSAISYLLFDYRDVNNVEINEDLNIVTNKVNSQESFVQDWQSKICTLCKKRKSLRYFNKSKIGRLGRKPRCKECVKSDGLMSKYGISELEYKRLFSLQNHSCAICKIDSSKVDFLYVDHEHSDSGRVRGLLCKECNWGLGIFEDNLTLLQKAVDYLTNDKFFLVKG
tara:strand:+ start:1730 stop:2584 length:855 start_codon:yes stop_codon:yes gene_type:complete